MHTDKLSWKPSPVISEVYICLDVSVSQKLNNLHVLVQLQGVDQKQSTNPARTKEVGFPRFLPVVPRKPSTKHGAEGKSYW